MARPTGLATATRPACRRFAPRYEPVTPAFGELNLSNVLVVLDRHQSVS
jgi:hypothetical protein